MANHEYKVGDRVRVIKLPSPHYLSPRGQGDLQVGEELEIVSPVWYMSTFVTDGPHITYAVYQGNFGTYGHIHPDYVELISPSESPEPEVAECKCDIWIRGCTCGAFQREMAAKNSSD